MYRLPQNPQNHLRRFFNADFQASPRRSQSESLQARGSAFYYAFPASLNENQFFCILIFKNHCFVGWERGVKKGNSLKELAEPVSDVVRIYGHQR